MTKNKKRLMLMLVLVVGALFIFTGCFAKKHQSYIIYDAFDTETKLQFYASDSEAEEIYAVFEAELFRYHQLFDIYNNYEGMNNVKTVNDNAGEAPVKVDAALIDVLKLGQEIYESSGGSMNIALGSVLSIWHNYRTEGMEDETSARVPSMTELENAAEHVDLTLMEIDEAHSTVYLADENMSLDLGAIAKGYAAQKLADLLVASGVENGLLDLGGTIIAINDKPDGSKWRLGLLNPDSTSEETYIHVICLDNMSIVTSGDYQRYYTVDGEKYHHIIDSKTLMPSAYFSAVSVISDDAGMADALSTALFSMDETSGRALIKNMENVHVLWVYKDGRQSMTDNFEDYIE